MDLFEHAEPASNAPEFTVSEIAGAVKKAIEGEFGHVRIRGEVGRVTRPRSGHLYLDLKDDRAVLSGIIWKGRADALAQLPEEGMEVIATGRLTTFPGQSKYQIIIDDIAPAGAGALMAMLEKRKAKLQGEGLFDTAHKQPLPFLPEIIGVVTSPTGAVIRDILHRLDDRFPRHVLMWPVPVQGDGAAAKIAAAINGFNALQPDGNIPRPDVLIIARGGGSLEDLWQFNEGVVVRAAANSEIPLISAVGHETDTTLIDYASDRRAPTPTAAAEMAVPVRAELLAQVLDDERRMVAAAGRLMKDRRNRIEGLARGLPRPVELLEGAMQSLDNQTERLTNGMAGQIERAGARLATASASLRHPRDVLDRAARDIAQLDGRLIGSLRALVRDRAARFEGLSPFERMTGGMNRSIVNADAALKSSGQLLNSLSYERVLDRGFALVRDGDGEPLMQASATSDGQTVSIHFSDGHVGATIMKDGGGQKEKRPPKEASKAAKAPDTPTRHAAKSIAKPAGGQGSLF